MLHEPLLLLTCICYGLGKDLVNEAIAAEVVKNKL